MTIPQNDDACYGCVPGGKGPLCAACDPDAHSDYQRDLEYSRDPYPTYPR